MAWSKPSMNFPKLGWRMTIGDPPHGRTFRPEGGDANWDL
jgi:hypothetical protein